MKEEKSENRTRCFIALELPREAINYVKELQKTLEKKNLFTGKFTEAENLHLTLKFLGEIEEEKIDEVKKKLREVKMKSFEARLGEVGVFSSKYSSYVRVIWLKLDRKGIFELQKEIDENLKEIFNKEERFMSHITIARVKHVKNRKELIDYVKNLKTQKIKFKVDKFFLKKSELKPEGSVYEDLEEYKLEN